MKGEFSELNAKLEKLEGDFLNVLDEVSPLRIGEVNNEVEALAESKSENLLCGCYQSCGVDYTKGTCRCYTGCGAEYNDPSHGPKGKEGMQ